MQPDPIGASQTKAPAFEPEPLAGPTSVYRIYDQGGTLIYVGLTSRGHQRQAEHLAAQPWAWQIAETHWEHFPNRGKAERRERELIYQQHPRFNKQHRGEGDAAVMEFRLRADQYDLMRRSHKLVCKLDRDFKRFARSFTARQEALDRIDRLFMASLRENRPLRKDELNKLSKTVRYLEQVKRQAA